MEPGNYIVVKREDLESLLRDATRNNFLDFRRGLLTYQQAREILQVGPTTFKNLLNDKNTKLRKSKSVKGLVLAESVYQEAERLCR